MPDVDEHRKFSSPQEEAEYWRRKYEDKDKELEELEETFTDFQQSSKELESELERELQTTEKKLKDINSQYHRLKGEQEEMSEKSRRSADDAGKKIHNLQDDLEAVRKSNKEFRRDKQRLEQENDELERRVRVAEASLHDLSEKLNKTLEENAWLQTELEDRTNRSQETIQRLKDEIRDLQLEITILNQKLIDSSIEIPQVRDQESKEIKVEQVVTTSTEQQSLVTRSRAFSNALSAYKTNGKDASIGLVDDILLLVKDMERKLLLQKVDAETSTFEAEDYLRAVN